LAQAENEFKILKSLDHPNIVKVLDAFYQTPKFLSIVLEFVQGDSLSTLIKNGRTSTPPLVKKRIMKELALGIQYLSHQGVCHRGMNVLTLDLKPENIVLTLPSSQISRSLSLDGPLVKILDFGLADRDRFAYCPRGMQIYHAPEGLYPTKDHLDCTKYAAFLIIAGRLSSYWELCFTNCNLGLNPFSANSGDDIADEIASGYVDLSWYVENDA
jgi:serine/threonine protein kinase